MEKKIFKNLILENLTEDETKRLAELTDITRFDFKTETEMDKAMLAIQGIKGPFSSYRCYYDENGTPHEYHENVEADQSLSELAGGNKEVALILIRALERDDDLGTMKDELLERFLFDNDDPKDDKLQKEILADMVKKIRNTTGLSQQKFANEYNVSRKTLAAWECMDRKITKYSYNYIKNIVSDNIPAISNIKLATLPIELISTDALNYLKACASCDNISDGPAVGHIEENLFYEEGYIIDIEDYEQIINGKVVDFINTFKNDEIKKCVIEAARHGCSKLLFRTAAGKDEAYMYGESLEGNFDDKLKALFSKKKVYHG